MTVSILNFGTTDIQWNLCNLLILWETNNDSKSLRVMNIGISTTNQRVVSINISITNLRASGNKQVLKKVTKGFPGGAVVENLPASAGDTGSSPGLGRSHMPRSNWAREPQLRSLHVWSLCSATREAATVRGPCTAMKSGPRLLQLEKVLAQKRRPNTAINK